MRNRTFQRVLGAIGELFLTAGALIVLFVVWQLVYLGWVDGRAQADVVAQLEQQFDSGTAASAPQTPGSTPTTAGSKGPSLKDGQVFAILRIPRLGDGWAKPVYQGVGLNVLAKGMGHYVETVAPGAIGNTAIAGHRSGHGNPLLNIDSVVIGDYLTIETRAGTYVYQAARIKIVDPSDTNVILPVPEQPGVSPTERWFTLTTCNPRWGNSHRYIVFSKYVTMVPRGKTVPAAYTQISEGN